VTRAAARRVGLLLADAGHLEQPDDAFYLTLDELTGDPAADWPERVAARRAEQAEYRKLRLPQSWKGVPRPTDGAAATATTGLELAGIGASPGIVQGRVRVVTDPTFAEVEPGEILVATTTDPSWASIMFISSGLVVDVGGPMSHAAVVARELGLPCVVNTHTGSRVLRTGDLVRVDGADGSVHVLRRAADRPPS
jgi:pyruvate,water dikinase